MPSARCPLLKLPAGGARAREAEGNLPKLGGKSGRESPAGVSPKLFLFLYLLPSRFPFSKCIFRRPGPASRLGPELLVSPKTISSSPNHSSGVLAVNLQARVTPLNHVARSNGDPQQRERGMV